MLLCTPNQANVFKLYSFPWMRFESKHIRCCCCRPYFSLFVDFVFFISSRCAKEKKNTTRKTRKTHKANKEQYLKESTPFCRSNVAMWILAWHIDALCLNLLFLFVISIAQWIWLSLEMPHRYIVWIHTATENDSRTAKVPSTWYSKATKRKKTLAFAKFETEKEKRRFRELRIAKETDK